MTLPPAEQGLTRTVGLVVLKGVATPQFYQGVIVKITQRLLLLLTLLLTTEGCFHFVPESDVAPTRGSSIRLYLERPASFQLTEITVNNVNRVEGEMVGRDAGDVILSATWLDTGTGIGFAGEGWTLGIPEPNVSAFELKRLSWWRTGAVLLGGALGTFFGFDALGAGTEGSAGSGGAGPAL